MPARAPLRVAWEGHLDGERYGSWAMVNSRLWPALQARDDLQVEPIEVDREPILDTLAPEYDVWVTHYYPGLSRQPDTWRLPPTRARHWVVWLAWEHGRLPAAWEDTLRAGRVAEVWVPSQHTRRLVLASTGLDPSGVHVLPYGVNTAVYHPDAHPWQRVTDAFRVLFVGGPIWRKGVDLVIDAYSQAFKEDEPTRLVLKLQGTQSFYREAPPLRMPARTDIQILTGDQYTDTEMAGLYATCNVVCQPYRAEGFCLPLLEAMATGTPVVFPAAGPAPEYTAQGAPGIAVPLLKGEPSVIALAKALRWMYTHPDSREYMGQQARNVSLALDWKHIAQGISERLHQVVKRTTGDAFTPPAGAGADAETEAGTPLARRRSVRVRSSTPPPPRSVPRTAM